MHAQGPAPAVTRVVATTALAIERWLDAVQAGTLVLVRILALVYLAFAWLATCIVLMTLAGFAALTGDTPIADRLMHDGGHEPWPGLAWARTGHRA